MITFLYIRRLVYRFVIAATLVTACATPIPSTLTPTESPNPTLITASPIPTLLPTSTLIPSQEPTSSVIQMRGGFAPSDCQLPTMVAPTAAPTPPGLNSIDPSTGLHMTGKAVMIDINTYRLTITGLVDHPLELTYDDIRCLPKVEASCVLVCPGVFIDEATWAGAPIESVLVLAGIQEGAQTLRMESADGYYTRVELKTAIQAQAFLAYEMEGQTLPILHGFPIRAVFPGLDGNRWVKWLVKIEVE